jgi:hypothetical protein
MLAPYYILQTSLHITAEIWKHYYNYTNKILRRYTFGYIYNKKIRIHNRHNFYTRQWGLGTGWGNNLKRVQREQMRFTLTFTVYYDTTTKYTHKREYKYQKNWPQHLQERGQIKTNRWDQNILEARCRSTGAGARFMITDGVLASPVAFVCYILLELMCFHILDQCLIANVLL